MSDDVSETRRAHDLVRDVILAQTNVFIKELLRRKGYTGATNKQQIEGQLREAIDSGSLTYDDLTNWMEQTEGWGNEHVYLYKVPDGLVEWLSNPTKIKARLEKEGRGYLWQADRSLLFPEICTLTGVYHAHGELMFVWHEGAGYKRRASEKDFEEDDEYGEHYYYQAYRRVSQRDVTRVVVRGRLLAIFLPGDHLPATHVDRRAYLAEESKSFAPFTGWELYSMGEAIKALDTASLRPSLSDTLRAPNTRWNATGGGYVDFGSETDGSYASVDELREVRAAVRRTKFKGGHGQFRLTLPPLHGARSRPNEKERVAKVHLYSEYDRIRLTAQLTSDDVW